MTGTTIAQAIPVAISPVLTRLYGPEDFGVLALFIAVTSIFGAIASGRYEMAIMLPDSDEDALNIAALGALIALCVSLLLLGVVIVFNRPIGDLLNNQQIQPWLYFAPLTVLFIGIFNALNYYNNRMKRYPDIARAVVTKGVVMASTQLLLGALKVGAGGLVAGQVLSSIFANARLLNNTLSAIDWRSAISHRRMRALAFRYRDFPKFSMPAILANTMSQHFTNILVSAFFSVSTLGFYSLVQRVLGMPTSIVGTSVSQVFFRQAMSEKSKTGLARSTFDGTVRKLALIAVPGFAGLFFLVEPLFTFVFGDSWRVAGQYAQLLVPFFAIRFVVAAVSTVNSVFEKQRISLAWQVLLLVATIATVVTAHIMEVEFETFLLSYSIVGSACYLLLLYLLFLTARGRL